MEEQNWKRATRNGLFDLNVTFPPGLRIEGLRFRWRYFSISFLELLVFRRVVRDFTQVLGGGFSIVGFGPKTSFGSMHANEFGLLWYPLGVLVWPLAEVDGDSDGDQEKPDFGYGYLSLQLYYRYTFRKAHLEFGLKVPPLWYNRDKRSGTPLALPYIGLGF